MSEPIVLDEVPIKASSLNPERKFNMSPILSGLVSGLPSLIGGGISALAQHFTNEKNYERQLAMYKENREYNSPKSQMQRFREAGLNPNLIYGMTNTAQPVAVGNSLAPNFDFIGNSATSALNDFRLTDSNNINRAIGYLNYGLSRVNLDWLSEEKKVAFNQMLEAINNLRLDGDIKGFEKAVKAINYDYDYSMYELGLPPDLDPKEKAIISSISSFLDWIGIVDSKEFIQMIFPIVEGRERISKYKGSHRGNKQSKQKNNPK